LFEALRAAGHTVSVILPNTQKSWIGKAHFIDKTLRPTYYTPGTPHQDNGIIHSRPQQDGSSDQEWVLIDGTPASCVQIGLYHYFEDRGPIDLVVSGPNYGRNTTALFALSSGTLGAALEAAGCRMKSIAISYAFDSREHDPVLIDGASKHSVRVIEYLYNNWGADTDLYSINVPLVPEVWNHKVLYTYMLENRWAGTSMFKAVPSEESESAEEREMSIREGESDGPKLQGQTEKKAHVHFKFAPKFTDVFNSVAESPPGNDGWAVINGYTRYWPCEVNNMLMNAA
jgi:tubulin--tyrosine ligase